MNILRAVCIFFFTSMSYQATANLITNGDFETGDTTGWTTFLANANSDLGIQTVDEFDVNGSGLATQAAFFQVGRTSGASEQGGGGIFQNFDFAGGDLAISVDIAASRLDTTIGNFSAGIFSLFINDNLIDTVDFGSIDGGAIERDTLSGTIAGLSAGLQEIKILMTRPFGNGGIPLTPVQYVDNVSVTVSSPGVFLFMLIGGLFLATKRIRALKK